MGVLKRNIGIRFDDQRAYARVWAPEANQVAVKLVESGEVLPLMQDSPGYWSLQTDKIKDGSRYWLVIDGDTELPDPASILQPDGVHGPSQALSLDFEWKAATGNNWENIPLKDYIIYELHTGTFSDEGDFDGITKRLDHLLELGVTAIEIMPLASFPGTRNWGYDGVFPFAVQA